MENVSDSRTKLNYRNISFQNSLKIASWFLYVTLAILFGILTWSSFRGIDITDESFYLLGYIHGIKPTSGFSYFHSIFTQFFGFLNLSIPEIRIGAIIIQLLCSALFSHSIVLFLQKLSLIQNEKWSFRFAFATIAIGSFLGSSWLPQVPSYNTFSSLILQMILTCYLYTQVVKNNIYRWVIYGILGFFLLSSFFNKFPNLVTSIACLVIYNLLVPNQRTWANKLIPNLKGFLSALLGGVLFTLLMFGSNAYDEVSSYVQSIVSIRGMGSSGNYLNVYWRDFLNLLTRTSPYLIIVISYGASFLLPKRFSNHKLARELQKSIPLILLVVFALINESYIGGSEKKYFLFDIYFLSIFLFGSFLLTNAGLAKYEKYKIVMFVLLILSFLSGGLGTGNALTIQFMSYGVFIFAAFTAVSLALKDKVQVVFICFVMCIASAQIVTAITLQPYREAHGAEAQDIKVNLARFGDLKVDSAKNNLIHQLAEIRNMDADYMFTYSTQLGLILFSEKKPYAFGWCEEDPVFCAKLIEKEKQIPPECIVFIIPDKVEMDLLMQLALAAKGIYFPNEYTLLKQIGYIDCQFGGYRVINIFVHNSVTSENIAS